MLSREANNSNLPIILQIGKKIFTFTDGKRIWQCCNTTDGRNTNRIEATSDEKLEPRNMGFT
jgi:hypothetical protein